MQSKPEAGALATLRRAVELYRLDKARHIGDIAVLKSDAFRVRIRAEHREAMGAVRGYLPEIDLDALGAMAPNTFGAAYAAFMRDNALSPFVLTEAIDEPTRARNAFGIRYATTHDMFHVLLGFDTSWAGELGVLSFAVAQNYTFSQRVAAALAWLVYPVLSGFRIPTLWRAWKRGRAAGRRCPCLLAIRLEERFGDDLQALRRELGLAPEPLR